MRGDCAVSEVAMSRTAGVRFPVDEELLFTTSRLVVGSTQPSIRWILEVLSMGVRRPDEGSHHSLFLVPTLQMPEHRL
jgi:hypothetical protein